MNRKRQTAKINIPVYKNLVHITLQVEEIIVTSHQKKIDLSDKDANKARADVNESLLRWIGKGYLKSTSGSGSTSLWAEWDLVEALLSALNSLFPETMFNQTKDENFTNSSVGIQDCVINLLESKSSDDFAN